MAVGLARVNRSRRLRWKRSRKKKRRKKRNSYKDKRIWIRMGIKMGIRMRMKVKRNIKQNKNSNNSSNSSNNNNYKYLNNNNNSNKMNKLVDNIMLIIRQINNRNLVRSIIIMEITIHILKCKNSITCLTNRTLAISHNTNM